MTRRALSGEDLSWGIREGFFYERDEMLKCDRDLIWLRSNGMFGTHLWNLALEGYLLHARNLIDFFYESKNPKPDDVLAIDFAPSWKTTRPPRSELLTMARQRMNKMLSHLTYSRRELKLFSWATGDIRKQLEALIEQFLSEIPASTLQRCGIRGDSG